MGDSRAVASVRGHAQLLSFDHKPNHDREMKRIKAAGGFVEFNRVNGNLALSRALGDFNFKRNEHRVAEEQIVTGVKSNNLVFCLSPCNIVERNLFLFLLCNALYTSISKMTKSISV